MRCHACDTRTNGQTVESRAVFCLSRIRNCNVWLVLAGVWCGGKGPVQYGSNYMCTLSCIWSCIYMYFIWVHISMLVFFVFTFLFFEFLIVEMKSKLSAAPITTQFRLKVVCVQCSDEISTVSLFFLFVSVCVFRWPLFLWYRCDWMRNYFALVVCLLVCLYACLFDCCCCFFYWRLWIASGGCSVWQMRILEDIIMFSSFRKYFNENLQSTTLSIIFFTMSKEREYFRGYWCREKLTILFVKVWRGAGFRDVILIGRPDGKVWRKGFTELLQIF